MLPPTPPPPFVPTAEDVAIELHCSALSHPEYSRRYIRQMARRGVDLAEVTRLESARVDLIGRMLAGLRADDANRGGLEKSQAHAQASLRLLAEVAAAGKAVV